jgi:NurA-like 5'-3' nuclease
MVMPELLLDIIETRDEKLAVIRDNKIYPKIIQEARRRWRPYEPKDHNNECVSIGIDGSYNKTQFRGYDLYAMQVAAVDSISNIKSKQWVHGLAVTMAQTSLTIKSLLLEAKVTEQMLAVAEETLMEEYSADAGGGADSSNNNGLPEMILIDGSLAVWLVTARLSPRESNNIEGPRQRITSFIKTLQINNKNSRKKTVLFISKNSTSQMQFQEMGSEVADMFYYDNIHEGDSYEPGFSAPYQLDNYFDMFGVTTIETYARLRKDTPMIKIELANTSGKILTQKGLDQIATNDIPKLLDKLAYHSVAGYPHCLRLAHDNCKITHEDMERITRLYKLNNETSARAPLHEE